MSVQLTVRIPDELADFVSQDVADGRAAERDIELLIAHKREPNDLDSLAEHAANTPPELD